MGFLDETIFGFADIKKATEKEKNLLILLLNEYACYNGKDGSFLNMMDLEKFDFYFGDATKSDGVLGGYSPIKPFSISAPTYGENTNIIDKCMMALPTVLHESNHAFQFGIPIRNDFGIGMFLMSKTIMPIGYIMNNLVTKLIDNSAVNWVMLKIYHLIGEKDINPDDVHVPFLYKFTIEHDSDKFTDMNKKANEFINKIDKCVAAIRYINRQTTSLCKYPIEEREEILSNTTEQFSKYVEENGEYFIGLAMKIVNLYDSK